MKPIARSGGRSAVAAAAYRTATMMGILGQAEFNDPALEVVMDRQDADELKTAVVSISDFYFGNVAPIRERAFQKLPIDEIPLEYAGYFSQY